MLECRNHDQNELSEPAPTRLSQGEVAGKRQNDGAPPFVEVENCQISKAGNHVSGDVVMTRRIKEENRVMTVLADGLGSGIKASVLATLTGTMALRCMRRDMDIQTVAESIMDILPVCSRRKIAYSTFTIADIDSGRTLSIVEHENPPFAFFRGAEPVNVEKHILQLAERKRATSAENRLLASTVHAQEGDRLIMMSDGVSQSGLGDRSTPLGWGIDGVVALAKDVISSYPTISARQLAKRIAWHAAHKDRQAPKDDISCTVIYFRRPRHLLVCTGPPMHPESDTALAEMIQMEPGRKIIAGGTTSKILARELDVPIVPDVTDLDPHVPPPSRMPGVDLVTEGMLTLETATEMLEKNSWSEARKGNAAARMAELLIDSDIIEFVVGTRVNNAHQDPNSPVQMDIRPNVVRRLCRILEETYTKQTSIRLV